MGCAKSRCLKWGPLPPNGISRIAQHVGNGEGGKEGKDEGVNLMFIVLCISSFLIRFMRVMLSNLRSIFVWQIRSLETCL